MSNPTSRTSGALHLASRPKLGVKCGGIDFLNPVLTASGTFGYGQEFVNLLAISKIGGLVTKGISPNPRFGNPAPRICETASGMLNSIGLENVGVEGFKTEKLPFLRSCGTQVLVNFFGTTFDEYVDCGARLSELEGVQGVEMNVSCPNIKAGGIEFGRDPRVLGELVHACRAAIKKPLWVKLTPNTSDIVALAKACADNGADAISLINTLTGMAIDAKTRRPKLATLFGGLSGPAIKPIALRMVYQVHRAGLNLPICGIGGIQNGIDAIEFLLAGAKTIQVGTQNFIDPGTAERIVVEIEDYCLENQIDDVNELVGALRRNG